MTYIIPIIEDNMNNISGWNEAYSTNVWSSNNGALEANYNYSSGVMPAYIFSSNINPFKGDYAITGKFNLEKGVLVIASRLTDNKGYIILLQNSVILMKNNSTEQGVPPSILAMSQTPIPKNQWFNFKLIIVDNKIIFYIENNKLLDAVDAEPFLAGNLGFAILSNMNFNSSDLSLDSNKGAAKIDDIKIYEINSSNYLCIQ
jgi:hypothetical protein